MTIYEATSKYSSPYAFITTSHDQGVNHAQIYYETHWLYDNKDAKIIETWHNHPNAKLDYEQRSPSGYNDDLTPYDPPENDREYFIDMEKEFGNRVPNKFYLYDAYNKINYSYNAEGAIQIF